MATGLLKGFLMRERSFRIAATIIGMLGIPSLIFQMINGLQVPMQFFALECIVIVVFIAYGLGLAYPRRRDA